MNDLFKIYYLLHRGEMKIFVMVSLFGYLLYQMVYDYEVFSIRSYVLNNFFGDHTMFDTSIGCNICLLYSKPTIDI